MLAGGRALDLKRERHLLLGGTRSRDSRNMPASGSGGLRSGSALAASDSANAALSRAARTASSNDARSGSAPYA